MLARAKPQLAPKSPLLSALPSPQGNVTSDNLLFSWPVKSRVRGHLALPDLVDSVESHNRE